MSPSGRRRTLRAAASLTLLVAAPAVVVTAYRDRPQDATGPAGRPRPTTTALPGSDRTSRPFGALPEDALARAGYVEAEFLLAGTAVAYERAGIWGQDGRWDARPAGGADYAVRMLVRRPADPSRFNGVVVVEWLNVTAQQEGAADFGQMREEIEREGYVWVGIGAQAVGVHAPGTGLKAWNPERYAALTHPGDTFSYDIFSQGARALVASAGAGGPLGPLRPLRLLATGRSQSASRLVTYINAVHPLESLFGGYFVHSRGASTPGVEPAAPIRGAQIRSDLGVPVLDVETEGDMISSLRGGLARQPAGRHYRRWEIAGAAHVEAPRWVVEVPPPLGHGPGCQRPINAAPHHAVVKAGLQALARWAAGGPPPPQSPDIETRDLTAADPVVRDRHGNARGGIRLPQVEAPTARLDGLRNEAATQGGGFCGLYGHTVPLAPATLRALYPTHDAFVAQFTRAVDAIVAAGYWLPAEGDAARLAARASGVGR
ncbi:MAG: hypothetical protein FJW23_14945 [Acidimicrobiia bacterium]|nr:hypothetical protein [Acidimicrobiia bacterium]